MRLLFKAMVVVMLVAGIGNYLIYLKTGRMPLRDFSGHLASGFANLKEEYAPGQLADKAKKTVDGLTQGDATEAAPTKVYKWTDADGRVHYGDKPQSIDAEQVEVKIQNAISPPEQQDTAAVAGESAQVQQQTPLEKARAAADAMSARVQEQESH